MRVIKPGRDPSRRTRTATCDRCEAVLEYGPGDIATDGINAEMQGRDAAYWIECPGCKAHISVRPF